MNTTLQQIQSALLAQHAALSQALGQTTDPTTAKAILGEMQEVLHRINLVQNLLFTAASQQLTNLLPGIAQASSALTAALKSISDVTGFLKAASSFLQAVDQAIDLAKIIAAG
jgi:F0F1-type ATP synthase delta subunit